MENFIVSARKYRPSTFMSVVGQQSLVTTLKNAISNNHLAHAYLFCGPRGVGKTTCARIFAKTINCQNHTADGEACNECESCVSFNEQRSYNIHELDAASNNSVEDIRSLIEQVRIPPQIGKYSVYIIDEVHMLSQAAFNAFLKTLEEPPKHALFVLATTEKHKIIPTILSRCQIYDFNRISVSDTVAHLQYVASKEGVTAEPDALNVIAQKSDGGMRDALSIFDQVVSFCGTDITYKDVIANLNVLDYDYYFKLVDSFLEGDVSKSMLIFNEILSKGFDGNHFVSGLSAHIRDVLVCKDPQTASLLEVGATIGESYKTQAQKCEPEFLYVALKIANDCDLNYRQSKNKRLLVEIMLIRLCQLSGKKKNELIELLEDDEPFAIERFFQPAANVVSVPSIQSTEAKSQPVATPVAQVATKPAAKPIPTVSKPKAAPRTISINNFSLGNKDEEVQSERAEKRNQPFTPEDLHQAWVAFVKSIPTEVHLVNTMQLNYPEHVEGTIYQVTVSNTFQEKAINDFKVRLMPFICNLLQNDFFELRVLVDENRESHKVLLPKDVFEKLVEDNEVFKKMVAELGLEII